MQFYQLAAVAAFAGLANAQSTCAPIVQSFDPCVLGPIAAVAYSSYSCDIIDFGCQCSNLEGIANAAIPIAGNPPNTAATCSGIGDAVNVAMDLCSCVTQNSAAPPLTLNAVQSICEPTALQIPPCALGYIADAGVQSFGCDIQDFACQCSNSQGIQNAIFNDVTSLCGLNYAATAVLPAVSSVCACVASNSGASGPSGPTSSSGGTTPATTTAGASSSGPSVSASGSQTSSVPQPTGPVSGSASGSKSGSASASGSASKSASGSSPVVTGSKTGSQSAPNMQMSTAGGTKSMPVFTGAGATASAFGGFMGVVAGLVAFL